MPGITLSLTSVGALQLLRQRFEDAQSDMLHGSDYTATLDLVQEGLLLGHVSYPGYPFRSFQAGKYLVTVEGRIYGRASSLVQAELGDLAHEVLMDPAAAAPVVRDWILANDGEYVVAFVEPATSRLYLFTDVLGRLPLYYYVDETCLLISRECKFIVRFRNQAALDRLGCAQVLWLGYPLGTRTLFLDLRRATAAISISAQVHDQRVSAEFTSLMEFNFDEKDQSKSVARHAADLAELFVAGTRIRGTHPDVSANIVSLSGGMDSRAVAAAMVKAGVPCVAASFLDADAKMATDVRLAAQVAEALSIPWELIRVGRPGVNEERRLVAMKDGLNYIGMAFILEFMEQLVARWGRHAIYLTGDNRAGVVRRVAPRARLNSDDDVVKELIWEHSTLEASVAEAVMGLPRGALVDELYRVISRYPEDDLRQKAVHFHIYDYGRWISEGEDRARFFLWESSPFYYLPFFRDVMRVPDELKTGNNLYRLLHLKLSPASARIGEARFGTPPSSIWFRWQVELYELSHSLPRELRASIKSLVTGRPRRPFAVPERALIHFEKETRRGLDRIMSPVAARALLRVADERQFANLWTLVLLNERWMD